MKFSIKINFLFSDPRWRKVGFDLKSLTTQVANLSLMEISAHELSSKIELSIDLMDDIAIAKLNNDFRHKDKPTNVLSFPNNEDLSADEIDPYIGDIAISYDRILEESKEQGKDLKNHYAHMIVHAILHLMGYDHESDSEAEIMEAKERKILAFIGIGDPYNE